METNAITFSFSYIKPAEAQMFVNNYKYATNDVIKKVFPNAMIDKEDGDEKFYSIAFQMDTDNNNTNNNHEQDHLHKMLRQSGKIIIEVKGPKPDKKNYDSYRFYVGIDDKENAVCILVYANRVVNEKGETTQYTDVSTNYYCCNCEISDIHHDTHEFNHLSCKPHCEGTSL